MALLLWQLLLPQLYCASDISFAAAAAAAGSDLFQAQSRILLFICYLLKNSSSADSSNSSSSSLEAFITKALQQLPQVMVRLLQALKPPLFLKRKTVNPKP